MFVFCMVKMYVFFGFIIILNLLFLWIFLLFLNYFMFGFGFLRIVYFNFIGFFFSILIFLIGEVNFVGICNDEMYRCVDDCVFLVLFIVL